MREYLDSILSFIGAESLTDEEFSSITVTDQSDHQAVYSSLLSILETRESVSEMRSRLQHYFLAKGIEVTPPNDANSNILVGACL